MSDTSLRRAALSRPCGFGWALVLGLLFESYSPLLAQSQSALFSASGNLPQQSEDAPRRQPAHEEHLITLVPQQRVIIEVVSAEFDTLVQIRKRGDEQLLAENDDFGEGLNSRLTFTAFEGSDYFIRVTSYAANESGSYQLTVRPAPNLPAAEIRPSSSVMKEWRLYRGELTNEDLERSGGLFDDYQVEALADQPLIILLDADNGSFDPMVQVFRSGRRDQEPLASNDDASGELNSILLFRPPENGDYVIRVSSYEDAGRGTYQLRVGNAPPTEE